MSDSLFSGMFGWVKGSRESEFVGGQNPRPLHAPSSALQPPAALAPVNPLLMNSNQPSASQVSVQAAAPQSSSTIPHVTQSSPVSSATSSIQTPGSSGMSQSLSVPANIDQTAVTKVTESNESRALKDALTVTFSPKNEKRTERKFYFDDDDDDEL